jgi:hypothetical protein
MARILDLPLAALKPPLPRRCAGAALAASACACQNPAAMAAPLKEEQLALWQELKKLGRELTPEELRQRGVRRVVSISTSKLSISIGRAINRTLIDRTLGEVELTEQRSLVSAARGELVDELRREEFHGSRAQIQQQRRDVQAELQNLRAASAGRRGLAEDQERAQRAAVDSERWNELRLGIQARLLPIFERLPPGSPALRSVVADLLAMFEQEHAAGRAEVRREADAEPAQLERRIAKLLGGLERTEAARERVTHERRQSGRASAYREVQGLAGDDGETAERKALLDEIFRANVELRDQVVKEPEAPAGGPA